jgi:arylsulfatase A
MKEMNLTRKKMLMLAGGAVAVGAAGYLGARTLLGGGGPYAHDKSVHARGLAQMKRLAGAGRPNVVLILCDDLGQGDVGAYGNTTLRTPNIDALAREGVRFSDFYASASLCTPSRAGLLTGRYAIRSGLVFPIQSGRQPFIARVLQSVARWLGRRGAFDMTRDSFVAGLPDGEITVADGLKAAGYRTMAIGKWHLGDFHVEPRYHPLRRGFDEFFGTPNTNDELPNPLYRNETMLEDDIGLDQARLTGLSTKEAVGFIERAAGKEPFFLYLAYHAPHIPLFASEKFKDRSKAGIYGDVVEELDWGVGEVLASIRKTGIENNTLVIFTSDNGPWYEGRPAPERRGRKGQSFEGGFQAPLIARWPGRIPAGSVCGEPAMNIDFFPTILALAGVGLPGDRVIDGKDIAGLLTGREAKSPHDAFYFYHHEQIEGMRAGEWKYLRSINHYAWPIPLDKPSTFLGGAAKDRFLGSWPNLYNMKTDPGENYDLASRYPEVCARLEKLLAEWDAQIEKNPCGWTGK